MYNRYTKIAEGLLQSYRVGFIISADRDSLNYVIGLIERAKSPFTEGRQEKSYNGAFTRKTFRTALTSRDQEPRQDVIRTNSDLNFLPPGVAYTTVLSHNPFT